MEKQKLIDEIKENVKALNALLNQANELRLDVKITQGWHPMTNMNQDPKPLTPPLNCSVTQHIEY